MKNDLATLAKSKGRFVIIIPVYNHEAMIAHVAKKTAALGLPVIVVDDGSTDRTFENLEGVRGISVIRHEVNRGKGAALMTGFRAALDYADWALTLDADGQHDPADAESLIRAIPDGKRPLVIGKRRGMTGDDVPWTSRFGRGFSNFWVRCSGGPKVSDSQSGYRIYPLPESLSLGVKAERFQFEVEILARAGWKEIPVVEAPVGVSYTPGTERISHFRPFVDFMRNSAVFSRLIFQRIMVPKFIRKRMPTDRA